MRTLTTVILATCLICSPFAFAQATGGERASTPPPVDAHASAVDARAAGHAGQPVLSRGAGWAGVMMIVILLGFFLPAAVIGPIARALAPDEEPETHAHDEHGGSHDHPTPAHAPHVHHH